MTKGTFATVLAGASLACAVLVLAVTLSGLLLPAERAQAQAVRPPEGAVTQGQPTGGAVPGGVLGTSSTSDLWRAVRQGGSFSVSIPDKKAAQLVQSEGSLWLVTRNGPLREIGAWGLFGVLAVLLLFYVVRGRIRIEHGAAGATIERFNDLERFAHWLLAVSFIVLGLTGLTLLYGRPVLIPVIGKEAFAAISAWGKLLHNYLAFAFMVGLVLTFLLWVASNIPNRYDLVWLIKGGGLFVRGVHPPSRKFNAGQKIMFWAVMLLGLSLSLSGISLLFPFELHMFSVTFGTLNWLGFGLPTDLTAMQEMQLSQLWHGLVALAMIVVILAHIYIGTLGMEGAFQAMGTGEVDLNWAREHHSVWVGEAEAAETARAAAAPAE